MKNDFIASVKIGVTAFFATLTGWLGILAVPMYILVLLNVVDYLTGIWAAPHRGEKRNSSKGLLGIAKKVCMWLLVGVGCAVDWLLAYTIEMLGITAQFTFVIAAVVAIWLICNEIISILENIADIGVEQPAFLLKLVKWVKKGTEDKVQIGGDEDA